MNASEQAGKGAPPLSAKLATQANQSFVAVPVDCFDHGEASDRRRT